VDNAQFKEDSSEFDRQSRLIQLFVSRIGAGRSESPEDAMRTVVTHLRRAYRRRGTADQRMRFYLRHRGVGSLQVVQDLASEGALQPIGSKYSDGFKILLKRETAATRLRFTIAHEICHTFFYESVPELKFVPHGVDGQEERLCNLGAAELLMPAVSVQRTSFPLTVCIESLCRLATEFSVSVTAMFLRLRSLRLWNCVFSEWHRMTNGTFMLTNFYGGKRMPWEWEDGSILDDAWQSRRAVFGNTFVHYRNEQGNRFYYPARFEVRRFGDRIFSLWGSEIASPVARYPLLDTQ